MFAPGVEQLVMDFKITSTELASFVVSVYLLGYCFGPLLIAPISEMYGRRWVCAIAIPPMEMILAHQEIGLQFLQHLLRDMDNYLRCCTRYRQSDCVSILRGLCR